MLSNEWWMAYYEDYRLAGYIVFDRKSGKILRTLRYS